MPLTSHLGLYWETPVIALSPATLTAPTYGQTYNTTFVGSGGSAPYTFSIISGSLPSGLTLSSNGTLTGTPTGVGSYTFRVKVIDANDFFTDREYSFTIATPTIIVQPDFLPGVTAPVTYNIYFSATGGIGPYTFSLYSGTMPPGVSISSTGHLTGVSATAGTYNFTIQAADQNGIRGVGTQTYSVNVAPINRAVAVTPKVLIIGDYNENFGNGAHYPQNGGGDVNIDGLAGSVAYRESALGFQPTYVNSYSAANGYDFSQYSHIWDVGYDTPMPGYIATKYSNYLKGGGAIFLLGENAYFNGRDDTIASFITSMGGGYVREDDTNFGWYFNVLGTTIVTESIVNEFLISNNYPNVTFYFPNFFTSYGTGTPIATSAAGPSAVVWKTGSLSQAPVGAIVSVLDINFLLNPNYGANYGNAQWQPNFVDNLSLILNRK